MRVHQIVWGSIGILRRQRDDASSTPTPGTDFYANSSELLTPTLPNP